MPLANSACGKTALRLSGWTDYWNEDNFWASSKLWDKNAELFVKRILPVLQFSRQDSVLDIGCGAGHISELIAPLTASYRGLDTAPKLLSLARKRCAHIPQASFMEMQPQGSVFESYGKFSILICVSVVQYFPNFQSVIDMVQAASQCVLPGAKMLIGDIPQHRNWRQKLGDSLLSGLQSIKEGYFFDYFMTLTHMPFSAYAQVSKRNPILEISIHELQKQVSQLGFKTSILSESVSVCANRPSLLIQF